MMHFELFAERCRHWLRQLSLGDWEVSIVTADLGEHATSVQARTSFNWPAHGARIVLNSGFEPAKYNDHITDESRLALHEVLHIALCDLTMLAINSQDPNADALSSAEHAFIMRVGPLLEHQGL